MTAHRREFLLWFVAALAAPSGLFAQSKRGPIVIGWLGFGSRESSAAALAAFKEGLAALGWKENAQFVIEGRWADGRIERLPRLAAELAAMKPAVIVTVASQTVAAAAKAAPNTRIVQASGSDPVATGFAVSLARPGGMITGISNVAGNITEKHLELLLAAAPKMRRIAFLIDSGSARDGGDAARRTQQEQVAFLGEDNFVDGKGLLHPDDGKPPTPGNALAVCHDEFDIFLFTRDADLVKH